MEASYLPLPHLLNFMRVDYYYIIIIFTTIVDTKYIVNDTRSMTNSQKCIQLGKLGVLGYFIYDNNKGEIQKKTNSFRGKSIRQNR